MRKYIFLLVLGMMANLRGGEIPQEGNLRVETLENGVKIWLHENSVPSYMASVRVVWKTDAGVSIDPLDCHYDQDEILDFFEFTKENHDVSPQDLAIIAVGDFDKNQMRALVKNQFSDMTIWPEKKNLAPIVLHSLDGVGATSLTLSYPTALQRLKTEEDLKQQWAVYFLQKLAEQEFKEALTENGWGWTDAPESRYLPQPACIGKAYSNGDSPLEMLMNCLMTVQSIRKKGFSEEKFKAFKAEAHKNLLSMSRSSPGNADLANYYAEQFSHGLKCPPYSFFIATSMSLISEMELRDVHLLIDQFLKDSNRFVEVKSGSVAQISESQIRETLDACTGDQFMLAIEDENIDEQQITLNSASAYSQLPLRPEESKIIGEIIEGITHNVIWLGIHQGEFMRKKQQIKHVHPMRFLGEIFSNANLKSCMRKVEKTHFQWSRFVQELKANMEKEYSRNNLFQHVEGFCQSVRGDPEKVKGFIQKHDWAGLVRYLIQV